MNRKMIELSLLFAPLLLILSGAVAEGAQKKQKEPELKNFSFSAPRGWKEAGYIPSDTAFLMCRDKACFEVLYDGSSCTNGGTIRKTLADIKKRGGKALNPIPDEFSVRDFASGYYSVLDENGRKLYLGNFCGAGNKGYSFTLTDGDGKLFEEIKKSFTDPKADKFKLKQAEKQPAKLKDVKFSTDKPSEVGEESPENLLKRKDMPASTGKLKEVEFQKGINKLQEKQMETSDKYKESDDIDFADDVNVFDDQD